jgi:hypothetical protein
MATRLTPEDTRQSLAVHVAVKGVELREKYGPHIGWAELLRILEDRAFVRYPCQLVFAAESLLAGEFAHAAPNGERPEDGFTLHVHPFYHTQLDRVALLVLYHLVTVNYGQFASAEDAETFGAAALGLTRDEYYQALCQMADQLPGTAEDAAADPGEGCC